jgi:hypothetical protein
LDWSPDWVALVWSPGNPVSSRQRHGHLQTLRQARPLIVGNGRTTLTIGSVPQAGAFLLQSWPTRRRGRKAYRVAVQACVRALAGQVEAEVARQALLFAIEDLAGTKRAPSAK